MFQLLCLKRYDLQNFTYPSNITDKTIRRWLKKRKQCRPNIKQTEKRIVYCKPTSTMNRHLYREPEPKNQFWDREPTS